MFGNVSHPMRVARGEVFEPVLSIVPFEDDTEATETPTTCVGSRPESGPPTDQIRAGTVRVDTCRAVSLMAPFGG